MPAARRPLPHSLETHRMSSREVPAAVPLRRCPPCCPAPPTPSATSSRYPQTRETPPSLFSVEVRVRELSCTPSLDETGHVLARGRKVYLAASRASWNTELAHRCSRLGWVSGRDFRGVEHERARGAAGDQRGLGVTAHKRRGPRIYTWGSPPLRPRPLSLVLLFLLCSSPFRLLVAAARRASLLRRRRVRHIAPAVVPTARQNCQSQPENEVACEPAAARRPRSFVCTSPNMGCARTSNRGRAA
ncbi:hypothetical protein VTO73DRAFT_13901 [Trametes versicolor]